MVVKNFERKTKHIPTCPIYFKHVFKWCIIINEGIYLKIANIKIFLIYIDYGKNCLLEIIRINIFDNY